MPLPTIDQSNQSPNYLNDNPTKDEALQWSAKVDHRFNNTASLSALYVWARTGENGDCWYDEPHLAGLPDVPAGSESPRRRPEQQLRPEQHHGALAALRLEPVRRFQRAPVPVRPGRTRLQRRRTSAPCPARSFRESTSATSASWGSRRATTAISAPTPAAARSPSCSAGTASRWAPTIGASACTGSPTAKSPATSPSTGSSARGPIR